MLICKNKINIYICPYIERMKRVSFFFIVSHIYIYICPKSMGINESAKINCYFVCWTLSRVKILIWILNRNNICVYLVFFFCAIVSIYIMYHVNVSIYSMWRKWFIYEYLIYVNYVVYCFIPSFYSFHRKQMLRNIERWWCISSGRYKRTRIQ